MNLRILALAGIALAAIALLLAWSSAATDDVEAVDNTGAEMKLIVESAAGTCDFTQCKVPMGTSFTLVVFMDSIPPGVTKGIHTEIDYSALVANGGFYAPTALVPDEVTWPDGAFPMRSPAAPTGMEGLVNHVDIIPLGHFGVSKNSNVVELTMTCSSGPSSSRIDLVPYSVTNADASSILEFTTFIWHPTSDSVILHCVAGPVGGVAELPDADTAPLTATDSSGFSTVELAWVLAGAAAVIALGTGVLLVRKRQAYGR